MNTRIAQVRRPVLYTALAASLLLSPALLPIISADASPSPSPILKVAATPLPHEGFVGLGDSYSSGQSDPPFMPASADLATQDFCHRSYLAYPELLASRYDLALGFYACSGAKTAKIINQSRYGEPPQSQDPGVATAALTTLTTGGDDAGFGPTLTSCIEQTAVGPGNDVLKIVSFGFAGKFEHLTCAGSPAFVNMVNSKIDGIKTTVETAYGLLRSHNVAAHTASGGSIVAAGYPRLFPTSLAGQVCATPLTLLPPDDQSFLNSAVGRLDAVLSSAAATEGVNFVDPRAAFTDHGTGLGPVNCGSKTAWIRGVDLGVGPGASSCLVPLVNGAGQINGCLVHGTVGSFHPNYAGQQGYAGVFESYINAATSFTPGGFPLDPNPSGVTTAAQADPVPSSTPSVQLGSLDIAPTSPTGLDCSGLISAGGEQLRVSGDGFTPGSSVPIYLVSPGLGSSEEVQLASVIADATGTVNSVITIPLSAKGFSEPDLGAGLAFLNAEGSGSQAASVNDLGMVGLTPVADACASSGPTSSAGLLGSVLNGLLGSSSSGGLLRLSGLGGLLGIPLAVPAKGGSTAR